MPTIKLQVRRDTATQWANRNPNLLPGELGFELDTGKLKIGRTQTQSWNDIPYVTGGGVSSHTHSVGDLQASGTRNDQTYLRGDGQWVPISGGSNVVYRQVNLGNVTGDVSLDANAGDIFTITLTGNAKIFFTNLPNNPPYFCLLRVQQGGAGGHQLDWDTIFKHPDGEPHSLVSASGLSNWFFLYYVFPNHVEVFKTEGSYS